MTTQTKTNWRRVKLGDVANVLPGFAFKSSEFKKDGDIPVVKIKNITDDLNVSTENGEYLDESALNEKTKKYLISSGDILVAMTGATAGKVGKFRSNKKALLNQRVAKISPKNIDANFLWILLGNKDTINLLYRLADGAAQPNMSGGQIENLEFRIPTRIDDQKQIADVLSAYDNLIENNTKRIKILEQIAQAIYREWFDGKGGENTKLETCFSIHRGKSYRSEELSGDEGVPFVNLKCIDRDGGFRKSGLKRFIGTYKDLQKVVVGDIVVAVTDMTQDRRIVAHAARVPTLEGGFGVISMDLVKLQPKESCDPDYLYCLLRWSGFSDEVKNHANGANVLHLNPARITDYKTSVASPEKQKEFGNEVRPIFDLVDQLELQNESLRPARDLLLPKLVTGEIEVGK